MKDIYQNIIKDPRAVGLPNDYPTPPSHPDLLFYIQKSQNKNTVVYNVNRNKDGLINKDYPMDVYWINYDDDGKEKQLNYIQNKLAYGYESNIINNETFEFHFVSYDKLKFFIAKQDDSFNVMLKINDELSILRSVYVYAEEYGVFPQVKFIELHGEDSNSGAPVCERIIP